MAKPFKDLNRKPTKEELEKGMADNLAELERIEEEERKKAEELAKKGDKLEEEEEDEIPEDPEENEIPPKGEGDEVEDEEEEGEEDPQPRQDPKKPEPKKEPDYKKRYSGLTSEANILYSKNKKMSDAIIKAGEVQEPTEEELRAEYTEWDEMTETERRMAKRSLHDSKKLQAITESAKEFKDIEEWNSKVDQFLSDPETLVDHPQLDGKEEYFKAFVTTKPSRMGADMEDLVSTFLYAESLKPKVNKGKMFENGSGGDRGKIKPPSDKISVADSRILQKTNYKKYLQLLKDGKIEIDFE